MKHRMSLWNNISECCYKANDANTSKDQHLLESKVVPIHSFSVHATILSLNILLIFETENLTLLRFSKHSIKSQRVGLEIMTALFRAASRFLTNLIVCLGTSTEYYLEPLTSYNASVKKCFTMRDDLPRLLKAKKVMSDFLNASTWHRYEAKNEHETK